MPTVSISTYLHSSILAEGQNNMIYTHTHTQSPPAEDMPLKGTMDTHDTCYCGQAGVCGANGTKYSYCIHNTDFSCMVDAVAGLS